MRPRPTAAPHDEAHRHDDVPRRGGAPGDAVQQEVRGVPAQIGGRLPNQGQRPRAWVLMSAPPQETIARSPGTSNATSSAACRTRKPTYSFGSPHAPGRPSTPGAMPPLDGMVARED